MPVEAYHLIQLMYRNGILPDVQHYSR
ncbi:MAG: hypothetical protein DPW16_16380 [Chloroflexi bacterium]|nr:hypothetical protein [Chloroflexota bacterium]